MPAVVDVGRLSQVSPGQPWPTVAIDIGNDGTIDIPDVQSTTTVGPGGLGPQPLLLRVIVAAQLVSTPTNGDSGTTVDFLVRAVNNVTIVRSALGCAPGSLQYHLEVGPTLVGTGISASLLPSGDLRAFVFGFSQAPLLLPPVLGQTCLLLPSPDVVIVAPNPFFAVVNVPLPASVRPTTFHVQAIGLSQMFGLATSDAFTIHAM